MTFNRIILLMILTVVFFPNKSFSSDAENNLIKDSTKWMLSPSDRQAEDGMEGIIEYSKKKVTRSNNRNNLSNFDNTISNVVDQTDLPIININQARDRKPYKTLSVAFLEKIAYSIKDANLVEVREPIGFLNVLHRNRIIVVFGAERKEGNWEIFSLFPYNKKTYLKRLTDNRFNDKLSDKPYRKIIGTTKILAIQTSDFGTSFYIIDVLTGKKKALPGIIQVASEYLDEDSFRGLGSGRRGFLSPINHNGDCLIGTRIKYNIYTNQIDKNVQNSFQGTDSSFYHEWNKMYAYSINSDLNNPEYILYEADDNFNVIKKIFSMKNIKDIKAINAKKTACPLGSCRGVSKRLSQDNSSLIMKSSLENSRFELYTYNFKEDRLTRITYNNKEEQYYFFDENGRVVFSIEEEGRFYFSDSDGMIKEYVGIDYSMPGSSNLFVEILRNYVEFIYF